MGTHYQGSPRDVSALDAFIKLQRASNTVASHAYRSLLAAGLSMSQFGVLEALYHLGPMSQRELARRILKSSANMTTVINNLVKRGLVTRERGSNGDRRVSTIHLRSEGRSLVDEVLPDHVHRIRATFDALTADELEELSRLLKRVGLHAAALEQS